MAKGRPYDQVFEEYLSMGFDPSIIKIAWDNVNGDDTKLIDQIYKLQQNNSSFDTMTKHQQKPMTNMEEDQLIGKAIQESLDDAKAKNISFEPLNPEQRLRKSGIPVGLKNVGNTCYFNSLLQAYFYNPKFIYEVLAFVQPSFVKTIKDDQKSKDPELKRKLASIELVKNLQHLFAGMIVSDKKYLDPTSVITSIVDDYGNDIPIGDQKDIGQFNLYFLSRVEEGVGLQDKYNSSRMQIEDKDAQESGSKIGILGEHISEDSLLKRSSIKVTPESTIGKQFFGKMETTFLNEKEGIKKIEDQMFTLLFVNVHHKELYTAFQQAIYSTIQDYRNQKGEVVPVEKQTWIKDPPKTLFFQIQRVLYDKQSKNLKKIHDTFDFPKEFYIDPFLQTNKEKSLKIRKEVTKLRQKKVRLSENLKQLQNYHDTNLSVSKLISQTISIVQAQSKSMMEVQGSEYTNSIVFESIQQKISKESINILNQMKQASEIRSNLIQEQIKKLQSEIDKAYKAIRTTDPYYLQSILIHEGVADSGHYYSYSYDQQTKTWRKYNDINVTEQKEQQVMKLARGSGVASAYYLVYAQHQKNHRDLGIPLRNYSLSSDPNYSHDGYSKYISKDLFNQIGLQNQQLYHDIQVHKAGAYISKVMDNYVKRFQACNQLSRKLKVADQDKKKNSPPALVSLPLYIRSVGGSDDEYKSSIIDSSRQQFGPKDDLPMFDQLLKNKFINLSDFKRPKNLTCKESYRQDFIRGVLASTLITDVYKLVFNQEWEKAATALTFLRIRFSKEGNASANSQQYFTWMSTVFSRIFLIKLLIEIQRCGKQNNFERGMSILRFFSGFFSLSISIIEQKSIILNLMFWLCEISLIYPEDLRPEIQQIMESTNQKKQMPKYESLIENGYEELQQRLNSIDIHNQQFNFSRQEDTLINEMTKAQQAVNGSMKSANDLLKEMKKSEVPFNAEQRNKYIK